MNAERPAVAWNPATYLAFAGYRSKPVEDLLPRIQLGVAGPIYDLGCGPGNVTAKLKAHWPDRAVIGIDASPAMRVERI
jgi:trans-aconitate 2-methyltransferase